MTLSCVGRCVHVGVTLPATNRISFRLFGGFGVLVEAYDHITPVTVFMPAALPLMRNRPIIISGETL